MGTNVVHKNIQHDNGLNLSLNQVQHRLNTMLKECLEASEAGEDVEEIEVKELGTLKTRGSKRVAAKRKQQGLLNTVELQWLEQAWDYQK